MVRSAPLAWFVTNRLRDKPSIIINFTVSPNPLEFTYNSDSTINFIVTPDPLEFTYDSGA